MASQIHADIETGVKALYSRFGSGPYVDPQTLDTFRDLLRAVDKLRLLNERDFEHLWLMELNEKLEMRYEIKAKPQTLAPEPESEPERAPLRFPVPPASAPKRAPKVKTIFQPAPAPKRPDIRAFIYDPELEDDEEAPTQPIHVKYDLSSGSGSVHEY